MGRINLGMAVVALALALGLTGCDRSEIYLICSNPAEYSGSSVTVEGEVTAHLELPDMDWHFFQLADDLGQSVWVQTRQAPPPVESLTSATGTVRTGITLKGQTFPILIDTTPFS